MALAGVIVYAMATTHNAALYAPARPRTNLFVDKLTSNSHSAKEPETVRPTTVAPPRNQTRPANPASARWGAAKAVKPDKPTIFTPKAKVRKVEINFGHSVESYRRSLLRRIFTTLAKQPRNERHYDVCREALPNSSFYRSRFTKRCKHSSFICVEYL